MTKKDTLFLLLPSLFFVGMALSMLHASGELLGMPRIDRFDQWHQQMYDEFDNKVQHGELAPEKIVALVRDQRRIGTGTEDAFAAIGREMRTLGWCLVIGAVLQVYVVIRVKAGSKKTDANQTSVS